MDCDAEGNLLQNDGPTNRWDHAKGEPMTFSDFCESEQAKEAQRRMQARLAKLEEDKDINRRGDINFTDVDAHQKSKIEPWNDLWRANIKRARVCAYILFPVINTHTHPKLQQHTHATPAR